MDPQKKDVSQLGNKNLTHQTFFEKFPETSEEALAMVLEMSDEMSHKPPLLHGIGDNFLKHFRSTRAVSDINSSVLAYELAVQLLPVTSPKRAGLLYDYGISLSERYKLTEIGTDIDQAIASIRKSIQLSPESDANLPVRLNTFGQCLRVRFEHTGDLTDISEAISFLKKSIQLTPEGHANLSVFLNNLGNLCQARFKRTRDLADLSEAITSQRRSVQTFLEDDSNLPGRLNNLGLLLQTRFDRTGDLADITDAIYFQRKSVKLTPAGHVRLPSRLNSLGLSLQTCYNRTGALADITEAISLQQKSIQLTPEGHVDLPVYLNNLGHVFRRRFEHTGVFSDISEAVSSQRRSVQLTPKGHASLPNHLSNLGFSLQRLFNRTGDLTDISEAITSQHISVHLTPEGDVGLPSHLNRLGLSLQARFMRTVGLTDINEAISSQRKAVQHTPADHLDLPGYLNNLGLFLQRRFELTGVIADISEAISFQQRSIQLTPDGHAALPDFLNTLGISLGARFKCIGNLADISEAISVEQKSVQLTPEGHASQSGRLNNLGFSLRRRFERTWNLADITKAISLQQKSIQLAPEGHADLATRLHNLADSYQSIFKRTKDNAHAVSTLSHYRLAAACTSGPPSVRLSGAKGWAHWARRIDRSQLLSAYQTAIRLISQVAGLEQTIQNRYTNLISISELSSAAAAAAIELGQHSLALEWLEQGRCLVWSQLNDLRTPIEDLHAHSPVLADEILRVSRALENAGSRAEPGAFTEETNMATKIAIQDETHTHVKLAQEWDQLLIKVRAIPQFQDFLRPASCPTLLKNLPEYGHVVVINIHQHRSDALVLTSGANEPLHISLPEFPYEKANILRHDMKSLLLESRIRMRCSENDITRGSRRYVTRITNILRQLWTFVVKPILNGLGYSTPASKIPRIWWCVSGPLAFLPLHAAGIYAPAESIPGNYTTLPDFAISSYTPTVRSLVEKIQNSREISQERIGLLMISQPDTPKLPRIPGTKLEVQAIRQLLENHKIQHLCLESRNAVIDRVKENMNAYSCIHFACHAAQDTTGKPLQSGSNLYDGRLELSKIIKEHLIGADLAFLSACQTSAGDERLSEEAVHLAGGMLAAGYRGVVGTMWSIQDRYGRKIAEDFYENLVGYGAGDTNGSKRLGSDGAAHALHYATQQLRKTLHNSESALLTWVPYVHFGV